MKNILLLVLLLFSLPGCAGEEICEQVLASWVAGLPVAYSPELPIKRTDYAIDLIVHYEGTEGLGAFKGEVLGMGISPFSFNCEYDNWPKGTKAICQGKEVVCSWCVGLHCQHQNRVITSRE